MQNMLKSNSFLSTFFILGFLCAELIVAKKVAKTKPDVNGTDSSLSSINENLTECLKKACLALQMPKPPVGIGAEKLLSGLYNTVSYLSLRN